MQEIELQPPLTWAQVFTFFGGIIMPAISITLEATLTSVPQSDLERRIGVVLGCVETRQRKRGRSQ